MRRTLRIRGHTISYLAAGEGPSILLMHGYGGGTWVWEKQVEVLGRSFRVYAPDLIGHGFSDRPKIAYTPEAYVRFLKDFMDGIGIARAVLIGNSMGGGIAWGAAALVPERVERLILIDSVPPDVLDRVSNHSFQKLAALRNIPLLPYLLIGIRTRNSIRKILLECVYNGRLITPEIIDRQYALSRIPGTTWVLYSTFRNARGALKWKDHLPRIQQPTLLIWGEEDLIFPPSVGEELQRVIPGSKLLIIRRSGHMPMWETPAEVNQAILDFLNEKPA